MNRVTPQVDPAQRDARRDRIYREHLYGWLTRERAIRELMKTGLTQKGAANRLIASVLPSRYGAGIGLNGFEHAVAGDLLPGILDAARDSAATLRRIEFKLAIRGVL